LNNEITDPPGLFVLLLLPFTGQAQILEGVEYTRVAPQPSRPAARSRCASFSGTAVRIVMRLSHRWINGSRPAEEHPVRAHTGGVQRSLAVHARAYYAFEALGITAKMHYALFHALHAEKRP